MKYFFLDLGISYTGTMLVPGYFPGIATISECKTKCLAATNCLFYSYNCVGLECYLKSDKGLGQTDPKTISAPSNC